MAEVIEFISLHGIYCGCEQCLWAKVQKAWGKSEPAYYVGRALGMRTDRVISNGLDRQQSQEAFFIRLALVKGNHASTNLPSSEAE